MIIDPPQVDTVDRSPPTDFNFVIFNILIHLIVTVDRFTAKLGYTNCSGFLWSQPAFDPGSGSIIVEQWGFQEGVEDPRYKELKLLLDTQAGHTAFLKQVKKPKMDYPF